MAHDVDPSDCPVLFALEVAGRSRVAITGLRRVVPQLAQEVTRVEVGDQKMEPDGRDTDCFESMVQLIDPHASVSHPRPRLLAGAPPSA